MAAAGAGHAAEAEAWRGQDKGCVQGGRAVHDSVHLLPAEPLPPHDGPALQLRAADTGALLHGGLQLPFQPAGAAGSELPVHPGHGRSRCPVHHRQLCSECAAHRHDGDKHCGGDDLYQGLPLQGEGADLRHGPAVPGAAVQFPGGTGAVLDHEQRVFPGEEHLLQAQASGEGAVHPDVRGDCLGGHLHPVHLWR